MTILCKRFTVRRLMIVVAVSGSIIWAWLLLSRWWSEAQGIQRLTGWCIVTVNSTAAGPPD